MTDRQQIDDAARDIAFRTMLNYQQARASLFAIMGLGHNLQVASRLTEELASAGFNAAGIVALAKESDAMHRYTYRDKAHEHQWTFQRFRILRWFFGHGDWRDHKPTRGQRVVRGGQWVSD